MTTDAEREYNTNYKRERRWLRTITLRRMLGGKCVVCGSVGRLEFDHIDKESKSFDIGDSLDKPWKLLLLELQKCQLLCKPCHHRKTHEVEHGGGLSGKKNCKCDLCKKRKAEYMRNYKRERK